MRHMAYCTFESTLLKLRHFISAKYLPNHHHHHHHHCCCYLFQAFKLVSSLTTPIKRLQEVEIQDDNTIKLHYFSQVLHDCFDARDLRTGMLVHTQLIKLYPYGYISLWNKVLSLYCQCGQIGLCHQLFETMPERDVVSFNTMISACIRRYHDAVEALHLYSKMKEQDIKPNHITLSTLIRACVSLAALNVVEVIHAQAIQCGLCSDEFVGSSLVDGYAKRMRLQDALCAFDEIAELDSVSWNVIIDGCIRNHSKEHALRIFSRMMREGVGYDSFALTSITKTCLEPRDLVWGMQLHGCMVKAGLIYETPINNALITMYSKCEEGMVSASRIFERIMASNIISWTAMISGFMQNQQNEEAVVFYKRMLRMGLRENEFSFASILPVYSSLASLEQGRQIHARIVKSRFMLDISVGNALADMYSKCGSLTDAQLVFTTMENRDVISWTVMVTAFGQHGKGTEALEIFEAMKYEGLKPDGVTFLAALFACSHCGLVDEGLRVFKSMIDVHYIKPRMKHYACVVDMLGRAGRLKEAERFIADIGIGSDALVWEALLGACRIHGEIELGEMSAKKIMELEPERHGPYVSLANIYADKELWDDKGNVRDILDVSGLKKEVGHSWVA